MPTAIVASLSLVAICIAQIAWIVGKRRKEAKALAVIAPSAIFVIGILARFAMGSLIVSLTPEKLVLDGEYRQYLVSWLYSSDTVMIWTGYLLAGSTVFGLLERYGVKRQKVRTRDVIEMGWFEWFNKCKNRVYGYGQIKFVTTSILCLYFISSCISAWTGSMDRGASYSYWAEMTFRPEAIFIAFARLRQIGYFLLPLAWKDSSKILKGFFVIVATIPLVMESIAGGRGSVLYPLIMVFFGIICNRLERRKLIIYGALLIAMLGIVVPYMAAYRDGASMGQTSHRDIQGRLGAVLTGVKAERIVYRYMALGREMYACSDGFIVEAARRKNQEKVGVSDLRLEDLGKIWIPRWIASDQEYEKGDGASIAKGLMGVENKTWFPCITTPADLFRRERWLGVLAGGGIMGMIIWFLDRLWLEAGRKRRCIDTLLITLLPVTYVQAGMYGTLRELIWQLAWELPKYVILFWVLGKGLRCIQALKE